jgi:hypothetical protein
MSDMCNGINESGNNGGPCSGRESCALVAAVCAVLFFLTTGVYMIYSAALRWPSVGCALQGLGLAFLLFGGTCVLAKLVHPRSQFIKQGGARNDSGHVIPALARPVGTGKPHPDCAGRAS